MFKGVAGVLFTANGKMRKMNLKIGSQKEPTYGTFLPYLNCNDAKITHFLESIL